MKKNILYLIVLLALLGCAAFNKSSEEIFEIHEFEEPVNHIDYYESIIDSINIENASYLSQIEFLQRQIFSLKDSLAFL